MLIRDDRIVELVRKIVDAVVHGGCGQIDDLVGELVDRVMIYVKPMPRMRTGLEYRYMSFTVTVGSDKYTVVIYLVMSGLDALVSAFTTYKVGIADTYCAGTYAGVAVTLDVSKGGKAVYVWYSKIQ